ncbi:hypothetical protein CMV_024251 [Castanea mollissima]|uniref:Uncharacterized protein n=1 Tax=Castanea mollissima TaxID=60419 RepID=A0A8J4QP31_9ROSI|nr:hypothetical protein CMV_024251 [Castanea mollissima]
MTKRKEVHILSKDEIEALKDEFHDLVLNQATIVASSSFCSSKGGRKVTFCIGDNFLNIFLKLFWIDILFF